MAPNAWINYHHLYYFKTIAEEESVSRAAEKLRLGQPTLSAQLKQFEEALGVQLFERRHKRLVLTEHGRVALEYAKNIFKLGGEMIEALNDRLKPSKSSLTIGALDGVPKQAVLQLVQAAMRIAHCQITLVEGRPDELLRELSAHRVDLLLTNFLPLALSAKGLRHRRLAKRDVSLYGAPKYKGLRKGFPESISGQPMILPTYDSRVRYDIDHWAESRGIDLDIAIESQDVGVKMLMAVRELGLLPASHATVARQLESRDLVEIGRLEGVQEELHLVAVKRKIENFVANAVMAEVSAM